MDGWFFKSRSQQTRDLYIWYFKRVREWGGKSADELREMKWTGYQSEKHWNRHEMENLKEYKERRKYSPSIKRFGGLISPIYLQI